MDCAVSEIIDDLRVVEERIPGPPIVPVVRSYRCKVEMCRVIKAPPIYT